MTPGIAQVMSGVRPYDNIPHELNVVFHVLPGGRPSRSDNPRFVTDHFWRFLEGLWHHQPTLRPEMDHVILMLQSLQFDEHFDEERVNAVGRSSASPAVDRSDEEEVLFGHPSLSGFNPEDLRGRLFKTGDYPFATGGNLNLYRGYWEHRDGFKIRVAIKLVRVSNDGTGNPEELRRRLNREAEVWSSLNHRNLLPFLGVWDEHVTPLPALISPFYQSGDLKQYLTECPTADKENIILGVASGLEYLHRRDIVHGDLKVTLYMRFWNFQNS
ncbi:kinase-like domain-containing protein [Mycena alexandri]|uniref:Kinase-like domain-containing protein n=1 Tax=Mycena alexandri TaxID=1745969 RepID=A0AAD6RXU3_9AGAR|nr:kinase-like domain-containing protein [Mycena alexandri]